MMRFWRRWPARRAWERDKRQALERLPDVTLQLCDRIIENAGHVSVGLAKLARSAAVRAGAKENNT